MPESDPVATATIGVQPGVWADLPAHLAALLAPPVVVTARPVRSSGSPEGTPVGRHRHRSG